MSTKSLQPLPAQTLQISLLDNLIVDTRTSIADGAGAWRRGAFACSCSSGHFLLVNFCFFSFSFSFLIVSHLFQEHGSHGGRSGGSQQLVAANDSLVHMCSSHCGSRLLGARRRKQRSKCSFRSCAGGVELWPCSPRPSLQGEGWFLPDRLAGGRRAAFTTSWFR